MASIPNVRYWLVLNKLLLKGDFTYTDQGVLDRTHLRFFTRSTMLSLFADSGFDVVGCDPMNVSGYWKLKVISAIAPRFGHDIRTLQYILVGRIAKVVAGGQA